MYDHSGSWVFERDSFVDILGPSQSYGSILVFFLRFLFTACYANLISFIYHKSDLFCQIPEMIFIDLVILISIFECHLHEMMKKHVIENVSDGRL